VRIPWGKLLITDPSSRQAFHGFDERAQIRTVSSTDVEISVFELTPGANPADPSAATVVASYPAVRNGRIEQPERFLWKTWDKVPLEPYFKKAFYAMQKEFADMEHPTAGAAPRPVRAGGGSGQHG